jgi:NTP pyrophosphatase (non-canonical NTP hydrolase)
MKLSEYQAEALKTDQAPQGPVGVVPESARLIPLLGLAGEAGQLLAEYKKRLRDGPSHVRFVDRVSEELGDILWYLANLASKYDLDLDDIARQNLRKISGLYGAVEGAPGFDERYGAQERFPRRFVVNFRELSDGSRTEVRIDIEGKVIGAALTDNAYEDDGYRFHDVFHLAFAAKLGWSPVLRGLLRLKRRSTPLVDEVEDGGRAAVIEEGVAAVIFDYGRKHNFLRDVADVDESLITTVRGMGAHLEVATQPSSVWRHAILSGFEVWRRLVEHHGGSVLVNLDDRELRYLGPVDATTTAAAAVME